MNKLRFDLRKPRQFKWRHAPSKTLKLFGELLGRWVFGITLQLKHLKKYNRSTISAKFSHLILSFNVVQRTNCVRDKPFCCNGPRTRSTNRWTMHRIEKQINGKCECDESSAIMVANLIIITIIIITGIRIWLPNAEVWQYFAAASKPRKSGK